MKKITTLLLVAGLVVSSFAGNAKAGEFKPFAQFAEEFTYGDYDKASENFDAATRIRFGFDYVVSEDLSATMMFQYGAHSWGNSDNTPNYNFTKDPSANLQMRLAYIDWIVPGTEVYTRMGRQAVVAPSYAFGSAVLDGRGDAVSIYGSVNENIKLGATWLRIASADGGHNAYDDSDALMVTSEFAYDGFKVAPWVMYIQKDAKAHINHGHIFGLQAEAESYVFGASFELAKFDPFVFAVDALYANTKYSGEFVTPGSETVYDSYLVAASAEYKLSNGTVALKGWYTPGADLKNGLAKNDVMPVVLDGGFSATTMMFGDNIIGNDAYNTLTGDTPFGTWGVVAEYAGFSFMDKLTHTVRVAYIEGTNKIPAGTERAEDQTTFKFMTEKDNVVEIDFNSTYEIYKNLSATLELGYMFVDFHKLEAGNTKGDDIFRSALTFVYNF